MNRICLLLITASFGSLLVAGCSAGGGSDEDAGNGHSGHMDVGGDAGDFSAYTEQRQTMTEEGTFHVSYVPEPDPIPVSELFTLTVEVAENESKDSMVAGADVSIEAKMPTHGHGMNTEPEVSEESDGTYTIEGMKFHMPSDPQNPWVMEVTVDDGESSDVAKFMVVTKESG